MKTSLNVALALSAVLVAQLAIGSALQNPDVPSANRSLSECDARVAEAFPTGEAQFARRPAAAPLAARMSGA